MRLFPSATTELRRDYTPDAGETIAAFANTDGGALYIGVSADGTVYGLADLNAVYSKMTDDLRALIKPSVESLLAFNAEVMEGRSVLEVTVRKGTNSPYFLVERGICPEGVFSRRGSLNVPTSETAIRKMIRESDGEKFEELRSLNQSLVFTEAEREFEARGLPFGLTPRKTLKLMTEDRVYTNLGLLLSDQCPNTTKAAVFEGGARSVFKERMEFTGSLFKQVNEVWDFLNRRNPMRGGRRDYPAAALGEALLNASAHRDYANGNSTIISLFEDRAEFVSLGGLPEGLTLEDVRLGVTAARNEGLVKIFTKLSLIAACGTGLQKIEQSYGGCSRKPKFEGTLGAFKVTLPNMNAEPEAKRLTENERTVMLLFSVRESITRKDAERALSLSQAMTVRVLRSLVEKGEIRSVGNGRNTHYISAR